MRKISLMFIAFMMSGLTGIYAQKEVVEYLKAGSQTQSLIQSYVEPLLGSFGTNLNNGWYSTAEPLNPGRFTISTGVSVAFVRTSKQTFTINSTPQLSTPGGTPMTAPTMFGANSSPGDLHNNLTGTSIPVPKGDGIPLSPLPLLQGSVGLPLHTEVMLRIFPKLDVAGYKAGYFGFGFKHDIKQWIPFMSKLPFSLSFIGTFTSASLQLTDATLVNSNETIKYSATGWGANLIISKKFPIFSFYGGLRLSNYKTDLNMTGNYMVTSTISAPVDLTFTDKGNQFGLNGGVRVKLGFFALGLDGVYNPGGYSSATLGLIFGLFN